MDTNEYKRKRVFMNATAKKHVLSLEYHQF
jgi:hypothetical protein